MCGFSKFCAMPFGQDQTYRPAAHERHRLASGFICSRIIRFKSPSAYMGKSFQWGLGKITCTNIWIFAVEYIGNTTEKLPYNIKTLQTQNSGVWCNFFVDILSCTDVICLLSYVFLVSSRRAAVTHSACCSRCLRPATCSCCLLQMLSRAISTSCLLAHVLCLCDSS